LWGNDATRRFPRGLACRLKRAMKMSAAGIKLQTLAFPQDLIEVPILRICETRS